MKRQYYVISAAFGLVISAAFYRSAWHPPIAANPPPLPVAAPAISHQALRAVADPVPGAPRPPSAEPELPNVDPIAELKRRLDDPQQYAANLARAKLNIEQTYGRLFQRLNLLPEMLERLKTALAERQLAMERGSLPDHLPVDDAEVGAGRERLDRIRQQADARMRAAFGEDVYAQYAYFQQSEPLRGSVEQITNVMRSRGGRITDVMQEKILAGYVSALAAAAQISADDTTAAAFQALSDAARQDLRFRQQSRFDEVLASTMSKILSPGDYKLFMESEFVQGDSPP